MESKAQPYVQKREKGMDSFRRSARRSIRKNRGKSACFCIVKGVVLAASVTVIAIALFAVILNWWDASDRAIMAINQVVKFAAILVGVSSALSGMKDSGVFRGACVGLLYMALGMVCYCLMMGQRPEMTAYLADLGMGLAGGGLFGMILTGRKEN